MGPIIDDRKENPINMFPKEATITKNPQENPITEDPERSNTSHPKSSLETSRVEVLKLILPYLAIHFIL